MKANKAKDINLQNYANDIINSWDMSTLVGYAVQNLIENLYDTPEGELVEEYNDFYGKV